ncbi:hypothetical protein HYC85_022559 [Camellia sinensis]|uniref:Uncharacterized protein n=1 Tax=Camellia sinensis TaxID=4442 RepID=A0A7J7GKP7_CAMSI|nr:hypothetical protein HYC85_022559 [Camellia sinensis]
MTTNNESSGGKSATESLYNSVKEKLNKTYPEIKPCIYKVPEELRKLNKSAYNPRVVSIGPIHNNNDDDKEEQHLKATEHIKEAYTNKLLCRIAGKSASAEEKADGMREALKACSTAMLDLEARALNCYAESLKPIDNKKNPEPRTAEKLLIDGCFILELLYRSSLKNC